MGNMLGALLNLRAEFVSNTWGGVMVLKGNVRGIKSKISIGYEHIFITSQDMEAPPKSVEISPDGIKFYYNGVLTKSYSAT